MPMAPPTEGGGGSGSPVAPNPVGGPPSAGNPATSATSDAIIPDASVYGEETAAAVNAYNNALATAMAQRNALYNQYGLNTSGQVDPNNPEGAYQQMLRAQADQYAADQQDAAGRGLRGGLAHQQEGHDRQSALAQDFQFQQQVAQAGTDYENAKSGAYNTEQTAIGQAYTDAMNTAIQNALAKLTSGNYDAPGTGTSNPSTGKPAPTDKPPVKKAVVSKKAAAKAAAHRHRYG